MRIAILSKGNQVLGFLDNDAPSALHFYDDTLHIYLTGTAHTFEFTCAENHEDAQLLEVGNKLAFFYKNKPYYLNIMTTSHTETEITVEAWAYCLELLNETAKAYSATEAMSFEAYFKKMIYSNDVISIGLNEVSDKKIKNEWTSTTDTLLKRLYSLADTFSAELEFIPVLNDDYTFSKIEVNVYKEHSDTNQGIGEKRTDANYRYGKGVDGITKKQDITSLYTAIRPTGEDDLTISDVEDRTITDDNGNVLYFHKKGSGLIYAKQAMETFPSAVGTDDKYICYNWETDYSTTETLYGNALAKLKTISVPDSSYEIEGAIDVNIGDTITVIDESFNPALYLETRVTEQEISFTDSAKNKSTFENTKELESQIDDSLTKRVEELAKATATATEKADSAATKVETVTADVEAVKTTAAEAKEAAETATETANTANSNASSAVSTANTANTNASTAVSTANTAKSTADTAQTTANTAKTATDQLNTLIRETTEGVEVCKKDSSGAIKGMKTVQTADAYLIEDANGTELASYGANKVYIGKNSQSAVIDLCNGQTQISTAYNETSKIYFGNIDFPNGAGQLHAASGTDDAEIFVQSNDNATQAVLSVNAGHETEADHASVFASGTGTGMFFGGSQVNLTADGLTIPTISNSAKTAKAVDLDYLTAQLNNYALKTYVTNAINSALTWETLAQNKSCGSSNKISFPTGTWHEIIVLAKYHASKASTGSYDYVQATIPYAQWKYANDNYGTGTQVILAGAVENPSDYVNNGHMSMSIRFSKANSTWSLWIQRVYSHASDVSTDTVWDAYYR